MTRKHTLRLVAVILIATTLIAPITAQTLDPIYTIPTQGNYAAPGLAVADLDGDGDYEFLIRTAGSMFNNMDPYYGWDNTQGEYADQDVKYRIDAYDHESGHLWTYDMGWGIEAGIWYCPIVVYDIDGDGRDELYVKWTDGDSRDRSDKKVIGANEFVRKIDPETGEWTGEQAPWPADVTDNYSRNNRSYMAVAYLDGANPALICGRGTYDRVRLYAYDKHFDTIWTWWSDDEANPNYSKGPCSHGVRAVDIDGDGRDEISLGSAMLDEYGKGLWHTQKSHCDTHFVGDMDPNRPGLEIFLGMEKGNSDALFVDDIALVDALTGEKIWGNGVGGLHVHGYMGPLDILPDHPGLELFCRDFNFNTDYFFSSTGQDLGDVWQSLGVTNDKRYAYYNSTTADMIHMLDSRFDNDGSDTDSRSVVIDIMGDWREEIVYASPGKIEVFTNPDPLPAPYSGPSLMKNRFYRTEQARGNRFSGYYYQPMLSMPLTDYIRTGRPQFVSEASAAPAQIDFTLTNSTLLSVHATDTDSTLTYSWQ